MNYKEMLSIAASSNVPVLILGESGAGKEVAAKEIHRQSSRRDAPFVALNCGAIPTALIESILEGAEKGAFTGAVQNRVGVVRAAHGGTLFLDEIGELPLQSQARLLRILQEKKVLPIGAHQEVPVDFRLICATNRNMALLVQHGDFREDLFFRLNVFPIHVPPLRERNEEFQEIAQSLWLGIEKENLINAWHRELSSMELHKLKAFHWPGNIRQLKNVLERYHLLGQNSTSISVLLSDESVQYNYIETSSKRRPIKTAQDLPIMLDILEQCRNNKSLAARKLGISRGSLCYQLKKYGH